MHYLFFLFLAIIGLQVSIQTAGRRSERSVNRNYISWLSVSNGMDWGSWGFKDMCPTGTYAAGFSLKVEEATYSIFDDNTALNGIRLHCINPSKGLSSSYENYVTVQSDVGSWGRWTEIKWCPSGFLTAFQLRVQSSQGIEDDSAANNIIFKCSRGSFLVGDGTAWGDWGDWSSTCQGKGICGIRTWIHEPQGTWGDDTALNDVRMYCCN